MSEAPPRGLPTLVDHDLTDLDLFSAGFPHDVFALHRREAPVWWHPATPHTPDGVGFWSVATHAEALAVFRDPATYSSVGGGDRPQGGTIIPDTPTAGIALNMMDDPRHGRVRRLVIGRLHTACDRRAGERAAPPGPRDLRHGDVRRTLRLPRRRRGRAAAPGHLHPPGCSGSGSAPRRAVDRLGFDFEGRGYLEQTADAQAAMLDVGATARSWSPRSGAARATTCCRWCVHAELPTRPAAPHRGGAGMFFTLLFAAGARPTRNATAGGLLALIEHPRSRRSARDRRCCRPRSRRWCAGPARRPTTVAPRPVTPSSRGHQIAPGDKVVVWEASANRDELRLSASR